MTIGVHVVGIDPGLVDTGLVRLSFYPADRELVVESMVVKGIDLQEIVEFTDYTEPHDTSIFIEGYKPRSVLRTDKKMVEGVAEIKKATRGKVLLNTGIKKVVKDHLLAALHCFKFKQASNHQDLKSAARILILGMLKDKELNALLTSFVKAHLAGRPWNVRS